MECSGCAVRDLIVEFKMDGDLNNQVFPDIIEFIQSRTLKLEENNRHFTLRENDAKDFVDYSINHLDITKISYKIPNKDWQPFYKIEELFKVEWVDRVIRNEQVICYYQPIVDKNNKTYAYELLSRFLDEDGEILYPGQVFSAAKERGRLYALDRICRMTAVKYAAKLDNKKAFINFIPTSIYSPEHCLKSTNEVANRLGVNPRNLVFEVVETEKIEDVNHLKKILAFYKARGYQYALDDVGVGHSTLQMLEDIKPHYMKLDMKYVQGVTSDKEKQRVALQFLEKALEIHSIPLAEGVEQKEDFEWLKDAGYQLFQGYYFGKPLPHPMEASMEYK
ncbi:EAL domain-containing protein [Psychrobacillus sp. MER TA 171]|uniref:EAL domain-containing protein n=1 Tax=Psychrobacillus sp. MER TA 171 TaxID=2939577 RepID=UPI00204199D0|nr:EAL domain-containing protein [Psychrobacillus sp. MER TA 171]MCM3358628.1 EAL domain-containing protein [Psychrobacillus sp. MER TA 171]